MEHFSDLAIVLKTIRYSDRDLIVNMFTENHGRITALAKGAVHSKRYGGSLGFLAVSAVRITYKESAELYRLDEAVVRHEFRNIPQDIEAMATASCMAEVCLKLIEERSAIREIFVALSNALFYLNEGKQHLLILEAFLIKILMALGYAPRLASCVVCEKKVSEIASIGLVYWSAEWGGIVCAQCANKALLQPMNSDMFQLFAHMIATPFKELQKQDSLLLKESHDWLVGFMQHHIPAVQSAGGLKSFRFLDSVQSIG